MEETSIKFRDYMQGLWSGQKNKEFTIDFDWLELFERTRIEIRGIETKEEVFATPSYLSEPEEGFWHVVIDTHEYEYVMHIKPIYEGAHYQFKLFERKHQAPRTYVPVFEDEIKMVEFD